MKKLILNIFFIILFTPTYAQQPLNGDFEQWEHIFTYPDGGEMVFKPINWTLYSFSPQATYYYGDRAPTKSGRYAICIQSLGGGITGKGSPSYLTYGNTVGKKNDVKPQKWGVPFSNRPAKVLGEYKFYNDAFPEDAGFAFVLLKKYNIITQKSDTVGYGSYTFPITKGDSKPWESAGYVAFEMEIKYRDNTTQPDSMVLVFVDSKYQEFGMNKYDGGLFFIDNVSLLEDPASISDVNELTKSLTLFPNPANTTLNIQTTQAMNKYIICQSNGTKVLETKATESIDVSSLPEGLYLLEAWDTEGRKALKKFEKR